MKKFTPIGSVFLLFVFLIIGCHAPDSMEAVAVSDRFLLANTHQRGSGRFLGAAEHIIYCAEQNSLSCLEGSSFSPLSTESDSLLANHLPVGFSGGLYYFWRNDLDDPSLEKELCCYSFREKKALPAGIILEKGERSVEFFTPDGALHISIHGPKKRFYVLNQGAVVEEESEQDSYLLGELQFRLKHHEGKASELFRVSQGGEQQVDLPWADERYLLPVEDGFILCNEGGEHLLYYLSPSGEVNELFSIPCMVSQSAITVSGDYVFLSVERWEKSGTFGMLHYEDDQTQGCYRINWKTGEATRLSGDIYTGLFVFHEDYLIGCDENRNTVWLDHDFRVLEKIH